MSSTATTRTRPRPKVQPALEAWLDAARDQAARTAATAPTPADAAPADATTAGLDSEPPRLRDLRAQARARAEELGFPTRSTPSWEHTNTKPIQAPGKVPEGKGQLDPAVLERAAFQDESARMVFVDGRFDSRLSRLSDLPEGVQATSLRHAWDQDAFLDSQAARLPDLDFVGALNLALMEDGAFVHVAGGVVLEHPLHIIHAHTRPGTRTATKHMVLTGKGGHARIVESWVGSTPDTQTLHSTELIAPQGGRIEHIKQQLEHDQATHLARVDGQVGKDAHIASFLWSEGGAWSRSEVDVRLTDTGASCAVDGLYLGRDKQLHDCPGRIVHAAPHTTSHELWKGILTDESRGIFLGNVVVEPGAQKTDSHQSNKNLLLSRKAHVDTTPQLEIHADDVQCAHGSTVGRLDPDALFFLRARGIDKKGAEMLLTKAFAGEVLSRLTSWGIRTRLERRLENWFTRGRNR